MMNELISATTPNYAATLTKAAVALQNSASDRPKAQEVVKALLQAEKAAKQQRTIYPVESLIGDWRLGFTAPRQAHFQGDVARGRGYYIPQKIAPAQISFHPGDQDLQISNQIQFGALLFKLTGPARYLGKKNIMAFDFTWMQLSLFNRTVYGSKFGNRTDFDLQSVAKLPFFAFFLVTEDLIAARGRGGGLAIWVNSRVRYTGKHPTI